MRRILNGWVIIGCLCFLCACQTQQERQDDMEFRVDASLLETAVWEDSLQIAYSPPKGWGLLPLDSAAVIRLNQLSGNTLKNKVNAVYADSAKQCFFVINSLLQPNGILLPPDSASLSKQTGIQWTIKEDRFRYAGFEVQQFFLLSEEWISLKLQFAPEIGQPFQLDFLMPKSMYPTQGRIVESVIGSVRPLKKKQ